VQILSQTDQTAVTTFLANADSSGGRLYWTGLTDLGHEGTYVWQGSTSICTQATYLPWSSGEPNDSDGTSDCVHIEHAGKNRLWNDINCFDQSVYALCQRTIV
jgi:hypothetical protein